MNWNDGINDIIREALQVLKQRQEAAQQQADIERLRKVEQRADELLKALDAKFPMPVRHHDVNAQMFNLRAVLKLTEDNT